MGGRPVVAMFCVRERLRGDSVSGTFLVSSTDAEGTQRTVTTEAERLGMIGRSTRGRPFKDYTGKSYRHWTVLRFVGRKGPKQLVAVYECRCDCGTIRDVMITSLTSKDGSRSCGCVDRGRKPTHGATIGRKPTPEFSVWDSMLDRCYSSTIPSYRRYGGRGIYVCDRWHSDFSAFRDDMGPRPSLEHSIDRVDNDGSYTCGKCPQCTERGATFNCRWATPKEQGRNKSNNRIVTAFGESLCLAEWAERIGVPSDTLQKRLNAGWAEERAVSQPLRKLHRRHGSTPSNPAASSASMT